MCRQNCEREVEGTTGPSSAKLAVTVPLIQTTRVPAGVGMGKNPRTPRNLGGPSVKGWPIDRVETGNEAGGGEWEWHGPKARIPHLVTAVA